MIQHFQSLKKALEISNITTFRYILFVLVLSSVSIIDVFAISLVPLILIAFEDSSQLPDFLADNSHFTIEKMLIFLIVLFIFKLIFAVFSQKYLIKFISIKQASITSRLLESYHNLSYIDFSKKNPNLLIRNLINSIPIFINQSITPHIKLMSEIIIISIIVITVFYINWFVPLLTLSLLALFGITFILLTRSKITHYGKEMIEAQASLYEVSKKSIEGYQEIKTGRLNTYFIDKLHKFAKIFTGAGANYYGLLIIPRQMMEAAFIIVFCISIFIASSIKINFNEIVPIAGAITIASIRLIPLISNVVNYINDLKFSSSSQEIIFEELINAKKRHKVTQYFNEKIFKIDGSKINFSYDGKNKVIKDIDFKISRGQILGIIGNSGSGKSTLLRLILGLIEPDSGKISLNNHDIKNKKVLPASLLTQGNFIFNTSIIENITLGQNRKKINYEKVWEAISDAGLNDFINSLPKKEKTIVGEAGKALSGGQQQRLSIARLLYSQDDILVFDEPSASLDDNNTKIILSSLNKIKKKKIIILVTHDKSFKEIFDESIEL